MIVTRQIPAAEWMDAADARALFEALEGRGADVRFVGGCVRDAVLGRPATDIDLATDALPERVMEIFRGRGIRVVPTGVDHGTVTAIPGARPFQVTTLRRDVETDGRRAVVHFTTDWAEDAARRDFTMNALSATRDGVVYDYVDGLADLEAGRVRFIGRAADRIGEDHLRILRFFRFYAHYATAPPDGAALDACRAAAGRLDGLSGERIWHELSRTLTAPAPGPVFRLMKDTGVLRAVFPAEPHIERLEALAALEAMTRMSPDPVRRLAALATFTRREASGIAARLRLSRAEAGKLDRLNTERGQTGPAMEDRALRRALHRVGAADVGEMILLDWADGIVDDPGQATLSARGWKRILDAVRDFTPSVLPISGEDVMACGVSAGPDVGRYLDAVEEWWIDRAFAPDRNACLDRLRQVVRRG